MHGAFFWYELMTTDTKAAAKFYGNVAGWTTQDSAAPGVDYIQFLASGRGIGGMLAIPEDARKAGMRPGWLGYVGADDVDKAAARIESLGGKVHKPPMDVPGIIRFAVVADPQGAGFIVAKPLMSNAPPALPPGIPGTVGWHELFAGEQQAAFAFYEKMFGWTKADAVDMGPMGTYQLFKTGGADAVGGMMTRPPHIPVPHWGYYINVTGIDAAAARVTAAGGKIMNGPMQVPGGQWIVQCADPQKAAFNLVAPKR